MDKCPVTWITLILMCFMILRFCRDKLKRFLHSQIIWRSNKLCYFQFTTHRQTLCAAAAKALLLVLDNWSNLLIKYPILVDKQAFDQKCPAREQWPAEWHIITRLTKQLNVTKSTFPTAPCFGHVCFCGIDIRCYRSHSCLHMVFVIRLRDYTKQYRAGELKCVAFNLKFN